MRRLLLYGLGVLIAATLIVAVIGSLLPKRHVAKRSARYRQRPETLFETLTDFAHAAEWRKDLASVEVLEPVNGKLRFIERGQHGDTLFEVVESQAPSRLVTRIADPNLPFGGSWTIEIAPEPSGARVSITEDGEVYNPIFRFLSRFVFGHTRTLEEYLRNLGAKFGEDVAL